MTEVILKDITKRFKNVTAVDSVSFEIVDGEFFVLLGPTGAGKTTTLRLIAGLEKLDSGSILFDGQVIDELDPASRNVAMVFQQYSLYPNMTVYENLAFPLRSPVNKLPEDDIKQRVMEACEILRITHLIERKTAHLSGGEMQRVSIGRAIVREPRLFLMDEPLSNLDAKLREALRVELEHIQKTQGSTTLFVTHDQVEALTMADRIGVLLEGKLVQIGDPNEIYDRPATINVAQLVGSPRINLMNAERDNGMFHIEGSPIRLTFEGQSGDVPKSCQLGVRPEDIQPSENGEFSGEITHAEPLGVETILHIRSGNLTLLSTLSGMTHWRMGDAVKFDIVRKRLHFFDEEGRRI
jgi:multiple sugar transport system ATP-binding protein